MKNLLKVCAIFFSVVFLVGCNGIEKKENYPQNLTSYVFNKNILEANNILDDFFDIKNRFYVDLKNGDGKRIHLHFDTKVSEEGVTTFYVYPFDFWFSDVFLFKGKPAITDGRFEIYLEKYNNKTKVTVKSYDMKVMIYSSILDSILGRGGSLWVKVDPTTIEEYSIIKAIGNYFGEGVIDVNKTIY